MRVLHLVPNAGALSEMWLSDIVTAPGRHPSSFWSVEPPGDEYRWSRPPERVVARSATLLRAGRQVARRTPTAAVPLWGLGGRSLARLRPDLVHAHFGTLGALWTPVLARLDLPVVVSFYGIDASAHHLRRPPWTEWYGALFDHASAVLAEGPAMEARLHRLGAPVDRTRVIRLPLGIGDLPATDDVARLADEGPHLPYDVVLGGRFVEKKGFHVAIEAFARAFPSGPERLLLVGEGPEGARLRGLVARWGIGERTTFAGPVPIARFARHLQDACVAVFPSVTAGDGDGEGGAPMTLPLAHRMGVRVVVSDHDDLPWAAASGTPVVPQHDVDALADAMRSSVREVREGGPAQREVLVQAAEELAARHDPAALVAAREAVYDEAVSR